MAGGWRIAVERLGLFGPALLVTLAALFITYQFVQPAPPRHITMASGADDGVYFYYAQIYRDLLAHEGIELTILKTRGAVENIAMLQDGRADVAFVQGGTGSAEAAVVLRSLASLYFEPVWLFVRNDAHFARLAELRQHRVAVDQDGSGTRAVALQLLADTGVGEGDMSAVPLGGDDAAKALRDGAVDAAFFVTAANRPVIRALLGVPELRLFAIDRTAAISLQHRFLSRLTLPEGAIDLAADLPPADTILLAPAANLVVRDDFHPALAELMLRFARQIHGEPGLFEEAGQFPSRQYLEFPLSDAARRFFESGPSLLQRYLPFWAANLIDRLKIMLLPLVTLAYPIFKIVPPTYAWRMRSRINRWYKELQAIERSVTEGASRAELAACVAELDRIERALQHVSVPTSYANPLYTLRLHIAMLRAELREAGESAPAEGAV